MLSSMPTLRARHVILCAFAAVLITIVSGPSWAAPSSITVDTLRDENDGDLSPGDVSLREAIGWVADGGLIEFAPELSGGTIVLNLGQLEVRKSVSIIGPGADQLTISGDNAQRVFSIDDGTSGVDQNVVITGLAVTNGFAQGGNFTGDGAGIRNSERLTLEDCVVAANQSTNVNGGVYNRGHLSMARCEVRDNIGPFGAGIRNIGGTAVVRDSLITGNYASAFGGGIDVCYGSLELLNSEVVGNEAGRGGGMGIGGCPPTDVLIRDTLIAENKAPLGAGVLNNQNVEIIATTIADNTGPGLQQQATSAVATIERSTIAANREGILGGPGEVRIANSTITKSSNFGIGTDGGVLEIDYTTISGNGSNATADGGGIGGGEGRLVTVESSIVAGNVAGTQPDCDNSVTITSLGHNLFGDPEGCGALRPTDLVGDPGLAPYTDLGKAGTGHFPLLGDSQAIDAGSSESCRPEDQLGAPRPQGFACDIGAIEFSTGFRVVDIDVDPWDDNNVVDPGSPSLLAVALLSSNDFDALQVDLQSLRLSPGDARARNYRVYDINRDRIPDLLAYFRLRDLQVGCGDTSLELTGTDAFGD